MKAKNALTPKVLIVDDDAFTRVTLTSTLRAFNCNIVGDAATAAAAIQAAQLEEPEIAVLDLDLGEAGGFQQRGQLMNGSRVDSRLGLQGWRRRRLGLGFDGRGLLFLRAHFDTLRISATASIARR